MTFKQMSHVEWMQAQSYVLRNCLEVQSFLKEYESLQQTQQDFVDWFQSQVWRLHTSGDPKATPELLSLSRSPTKSVKSYQGYVKRQRRRKTQNSGVIVKGDEESNGRDFFGVLKEVIELEYDGPSVDSKQPTVVLFRCAWFDVFSVGRGIKEDKKFGLISINTNKLLRTNEPFVLASQVGQVYYVKEHNDPNWRIVIKTMPRNFYNFPVVEYDASDDEHGDIETNVRILDVEDNVEDDVLLPRIDVPPEIVSDPEENEEQEDEEEAEDKEDVEDEEEEIEEWEDTEDDIISNIYDLDSSSD